MKLKLIILTIISLILSNTFAFGAVVSGNTSERQRENTQKFALKDDVYRWKKDMQNWLDSQEAVLLQMVASRSEVLGYVRPAGGV